MTLNTSRYNGKPLLRVFECYILWSIGELSDNDTITMEKMTPKLQQLYKTSGSWPEIVEIIVKLPPNTQEEIRRVWTNSSDSTNNKKHDPQQFAENYVDKYLR
jgi:DNA-directed RNA polymerase subunit F